MWRVFGVLAAALLIWSAGDRSEGPGAGGIGLTNRSAESLRATVDRTLDRLLAEDRARAEERARQVAEASEVADEPVVEPALPIEEKAPTPGPPTCAGEGAYALSPDGLAIAMDGRVLRDDQWTTVFAHPPASLRWTDEGLLAVETSEAGSRLWLADFKASPRVLYAWPGTHVTTWARLRGRTVVMESKQLQVAEGGGDLQVIPLPDAPRDYDWGAIDLTGPRIRLGIGQQWDAPCGGGGEWYDLIELQGKRVHSYAQIDGLAEPWEVVGGSAGWFYIRYQSYGSAFESDGIWAVRPGRDPIRLFTDPEALVTSAADQQAAAITSHGVTWHVEGARRLRRLTPTPPVGLTAYNGKQLIALTARGLERWSPGMQWQIVLPRCPEAHE